MSGGRNHRGRDRGRKAAAEVPLCDLEDELHRAPAAGVSSDRASADNGREDILAYIEANPGVTARRVVPDRPGWMTSAQADAIVRDLLDTGQVHGDPPGVRLHGCLRLYTIPPSRAST
jgi:hypothetical protein